MYAIRSYYDITSFLVGIETAEIKNYKHDLHPLFGSGKEKSDHFWNAVVRQSVVNGLLLKDIETYGVLKLTKEGKEYLMHPKSLMLYKERDYKVEDEDSIITNDGGGAVFDDVLYKQLVDLRKSISKQKA